MTYSEPQSRPQSEIEADLSAMSSEIVERALVDAAHFLDGEWAEDRILERVNDDRLPVRRSAIVALGVLARRRVLRFHAGFWTAIDGARTDPELLGTIDDLLDDIKTYMDRAPS